EARRGIYGTEGGSDAVASDDTVSAGDLGAAALRAALFLALWGTGAAAYAAWRRDARALVSARIAAGVGFGLVVVAALSMMFALAPENGNGPNALLQTHPLMALHPPLLYLGYVLTSVPFAYALSSLILGEGGDRWLVATRRFALVSWALLGVGIVAGAWWSYA